MRHTFDLDTELFPEHSAGISCGNQHLVFEEVPVLTDEVEQGTFLGVVGDEGDHVFGGAVGSLCVRGGGPGGPTYGRGRVGEGAGVLQHIFPGQSITCGAAVAAAFTPDFFSGLNMNNHGLLLADDGNDERLLQQVRPAGWANPVPRGRYHLVVIGGGTAGLVSAAAAAGLGARVALIESGMMGGDCLVSGCVPSKALLAAARCAAAVRNAGSYGVRINGSVQVDFEAVMERLRRIRADISPHDSAARFQGLGVDVYFAKARFSGPRSVDVDGVRLEFSRAIIAAGSRPAVPAIPGLSEIGCLTSESVFNLRRLPERLAVIGGGPIGVEMAQAFAACGSRVTLIEAGPRLLPGMIRKPPHCCMLG